MNDVASSGAGIQTAMLDAVCDALTAAFIVYDRNDEITFASKQLLAYFPVSEEFIKPGARLKDLLRQVYDCRDVSGHSPSGSGSAVNREEWLAERLASHWKERAEHQERHGTDRWIRYSKRRLPSGIGICVVTDISEQKKREDQWRADLERVQLTEEILDSLPFPILVKDRNMSYVAVNHATCTLLESPADCILGRTVFDIHARELASRIDSGDRKVLETGIPSIIPERLTRLDGEEAVIITRKHRVGKPGRYFLVTTMEDITPMTVMDENGERIIPGIEHLAFERSTYKARGNADDAESGAFLSLAGKRILLVTANAPISSNA
jgi:PAS domain S-box-containing protein